MRVLKNVKLTDIRSAIKFFWRHKPDLELVAEVSDIRTLLTQSDVVLLDRDLVNQPLIDLISAVPHEAILITSIPEAKQAALATGAIAVVTRGDFTRKPIGCFLNHTLNVPGRNEALNEQRPDRHDVRH
jgi:hypothetical protein